MTITAISKESKAGYAGFGSTSTLDQKTDEISRQVFSSDIFCLSNSYPFNIPMKIQVCGTDEILEFSSIEALFRALKYFPHKLSIVKHYTRVSLTQIISVDSYFSHHIAKDWDNKKIFFLEKLMNKKIKKEPFLSILLNTPDRELIDSNMFNLENLMMLLKIKSQYLKAAGKLEPVIKETLFKGINSYEDCEPKRFPSFIRNIYCN